MDASCLSQIYDADEVVASVLSICNAFLTLNGIENRPNWFGMHPIQDNVLVKLSAINVTLHTTSFADVAHNVEYINCCSYALLPDEECDLFC